MFVDIVLQDMTGLDCIKKLTSINPNVNAVATTGYTDHNTVDKIRDEGISNVLFRPLKLNELSLLLNEVFQER